MADNQATRFEFGKNWQSFVQKSSDPRRIDAAAQSLRRSLGVEDIKDRSFLDIGSGSGLFSLAACILGARPITSFDYDPNSVLAAHELCLNSPASDAWDIQEGSILDDDFVKQLAPADIVYSWGVLHHTGAMWAAIDRAAGLVNPGGLLLISIYNNVERHFGGSVMWSKIKCAYTRGPWILRRAMEVLYVLHFITRHVLTCRNPIRAIRGYDSGGRGMDFWHDMRDWLGGFPYEYATAGEVFRYVRENFGYELEHLDTHDGHGCNEFVFRRPGDQES